MSGAWTETTSAVAQQLVELDPPRAELLLDLGAAAWRASE